MTGDIPPRDELDELTAGLFARRDYEPGHPPPRTFHPWHRPRKQYVRREQWGVLAEELLGARSVDIPLRYLGLPGVDLIDLRYLYSRVCATTGRGLRFLGFTSEAHPGNPAHIDLNTSLDEVRRLDNVDPRSDVLGDDFRSLARKNSIARQRLQQLGPFDIVNLDLCDGLVADSPGRRPSLYDAMGHLVALQARHAHPWLLLVTTRVGRSYFDADAQAKLLKHYLDNVQSCPSFVEACRGSIGIDDPASIDPATCDDEVFLRLMLVVLCKWLLVLTKVAPARVQLASSQGYRVAHGVECQDLVSFALRIEPVIRGPEDPLAPDVTTVEVDECAEATRVARRVGSLKDVDALLLEDRTLEDGLIAEMEDLLQQARYDVEGYRPWVDAFR